MSDRGPAARQDTRAEQGAGIPSDAWLCDERTLRSKRRHLELLGLLDGSQLAQIVLDAGCGPGTYGLILARQRDVCVVGIDVSEVAIRKAAQRGAGKRFFPVEGDLNRLPFRDSSFDAIFAGWTLHHFPSLDAPLAEFYRVAKPGAQIAFVEPNEVSLGVRISRIFEGLLRPLILRVGWDSPNRTSHTYEDYAEKMRAWGFVDVEYFSCYAPLPFPRVAGGRVVSGLLHFLYFLRVMLFTLSSKVLGSPLNAPDLLVCARKPAKPTA